MWYYKLFFHVFSSNLFILHVAKCMMFPIAVISTRAKKLLIHKAFCIKLLLHCLHNFLNIYWNLLGIPEMNITWWYTVHIMVTDQQIKQLTCSKNKKRSAWNHDKKKKVYTFFKKNNFSKISMHIFRNFFLKGLMRALCVACCFLTPFEQIILSYLFVALDITIYLSEKQFHMRLLSFSS